MVFTSIFFEGQTLFSVIQAGTVAPTIILKSLPIPTTISRWTGCTFMWNVRSNYASFINIRINEVTFCYLACHICIFTIPSFVIANTNLFVEADAYAHLSAVAGGSIVIPCRPTSPDLVPILYDNNVNIGDKLAEDNLPFKTK